MVSKEKDILISFLGNVSLSNQGLAYFGRPLIYATNEKGCPFEIGQPFLLGFCINRWTL